MPRYKLPPGKGRTPGVPNKTTRILKEAAILAAEELGFDGRGRDGLVGYLKAQAARHPKEYLAFLSKLLPLQIEAESRRVEYRTVEEAAAALRAKGIPPEILDYIPAKRIDYSNDYEDRPH